MDKSEKSKIEEVLIKYFPALTWKIFPTREVLRCSGCRYHKDIYRLFVVVTPTGCIAAIFNPSKTENSQNLIQTGEGSLEYVLEAITPEWEDLTKDDR